MKMAYILLLGIVFGLGSVVQANHHGAQAKVEAKSGSNVEGTIDFEDSKEGLKVNYNLTGLEKNSKHGFHIHEKADCSSVDAKSAGPHYKKMKSGVGTSLDTPQKHEGDMPEVMANEKGQAEGTFIMPNLTLHKKNAVVGHAVIVHGGPDDVTKPSAPRVGCGVIKSL